MAKFEGTQNIPSEWIDAWRGNLTDKSPKNITRKRYPFRRPGWEDGGNKVTEGQKGQRERVKIMQGKFKNVTHAVRQRWYAARPPWNSFLWYFNYFLMSGLVGNAVNGDKGGGVIKDINHYTVTVMLKN